ncbi:hypothetical protein SAMN05216302_101521 [Nitrosomonas aestuarii]|uniref:Uncharacterized protein n=1 Tax=Nitrosomonas aestuarii TaxID=52441 RepID=A0A1I4CBJ1_9PROT|nr:hypothetical protein SAMN05216302_101521 [Nitrosomonas aestuarii]
MHVIILASVIRYFLNILIYIDIVYLLIVGTGTVKTNTYEIYIYNQIIYLFNHRYIRYLN